MKDNYKTINFHKFPDKHGRFGKFGGRFVAETLMPLLLEVEKQYKIASVAPKCVPQRYAKYQHH